MPAPSPAIESSDLTSLKVTADGRPIPGDYQVLSLHLTSQVNRIPLAHVELADGDPADGTFAISAGKKLRPGVILGVELGYHGKTKQVFKGVVTRQSIRQQRGGITTLQLEARDQALKLTIGRKSAVFTDQTDGEVIKKLISAAQLKAEVATTSPKVPQLTQFNATDWDFLVSRAEANGLLVAAAAGTVKVFAPELGSAAVLSLTFGSDVFDFRLEQEADTLYKKVKASAWDFKKQALAHSQATISDVNPVGAPGAAALAVVVGPPEVELQSSAPLDTAQLKAWAGGALLRSELSKVRGELRFQGSSLVKPGAMVELSGFGGRFDGKAFVSSVTHDLEDGIWTTQVEVGLSEEPFTEQVETSARPAGGLLPAVAGLQNATVKQIHQDPDGSVRVQVQVPLLGDKGLWARLASPYATNKAGVFFYPEVGDEVILGFVNGDPTAPILLGSLYSAAKKAPPFQPDQENGMKAVVTKAGLHLEFNDKDKVITVKTPAGNKLVLSDKDKTITATDETGNEVKLGTSGISLTSKGTITLQAQSGVTIKTSAGNVALEAAAGKLSGSGLEVKLDAQTEFAAQGSLKAGLQGGVECSIQGALVKIN